VIDKRHLVRVTILGQEFTIRSDATPEHTRAVAEYVDNMIRAVMSSGSVVESHKAAILAALQITDELFKERAAAERTSDAITALGSEIRRWLPPGKRSID
jgi:cell division protein ZapA